MRKVIKHILIIFMCITIIGCGVHEELKVAMGRYIEENAGLEKFIKEDGNTYLWVNRQGKLQALIKNEQFESYVLDDEGNWDAVEDNLCNVLIKHPEIRDVDYVKSCETEGSYYIYGDKKIDGEVSCFVAKIEGMALNEINMEWQSDEPTILSLDMDKDNNIYACNFTEQCIQVFDSQGKLISKLGDEAESAAIVGDKIVAMGSNKVEVYSKDTYQKERTIEKIICDPREAN